jgi:hypothetical protein
MKKYLFLFLFLVGSGCTPKSYNFAKWAVKSGLDIIEDAGAFKRHEFRIKAKSNGDTLFYYSGVNEYGILKQDSVFYVWVNPNRKNIQDTTLHYLSKLRKK